MTRTKRTSITGKIFTTPRLSPWLVPFVFLASIGMMILLNLGTNYFLGEISYITKALPAVQQQQHRPAGQCHRDAHIDGLLPLAQVLQVRHQGAHARYEALLPRQGPDL